MRAARSAGLVVLLAATACTGSGRCTKIAAESGVAVRYPAVTSGLTGRHVVQVCVGATCQEHQLALTGEQTSTEPAAPTYQEPRDGVVARAPALSEQEAPVTLRITRPDGTDLFNGRTTVKPQRFQPNGPGCEPTTWNAAVVATGTDTLTPLEPRRG